MSTTLNKSITSQFFATDGGYDEMRRRWAVAVNDKEARKNLEASHHLVYAILSGKSIAKLFTPITNKTKLDNGFEPFKGASQAFSRLWRYNSAARKYTTSSAWSMFDDLLSEDAVELICSMLPDSSSVEAGEFDYLVPVRELVA